jgi:hypothetical protein
MSRHRRYTRRTDVQLDQPHHPSCSTLRRPRVRSASARTTSPCTHRRSCASCSAGRAGVDAALALGDEASSGGRTDLDALTAAGLHPAPYPRLASDNGAFRAHILLLRDLGRASALSWMRALRVRPARRTSALAHWGEIARAPAWLQARMAARKRGDEHARLRARLQDWLHPNIVYIMISGCNCIVHNG